MLSRKSISVAPRPGLEPGTCGLTPISRRGVKTANESLVVLATIVSMLPRASPGLHPFLRCTGCEPNRAKHPSGSSTVPTAHAPWWLRHPRRTLVPRRVQECCLQFSGCQPLGTSFELARDAGDPDSINRAQRQRPFSLLVHVQLIRWLAASAWILAQAKQRCTSKG